MIPELLAAQKLVYDRSVSFDHSRVLQFRLLLLLLLNPFGLTGTGYIGSGRTQAEEPVFVASVGALGDGVAKDVARQTLAVVAGECSRLAPATGGELHVLAAVSGDQKNI